jgi:hypothetical protein
MQKHLSDEDLASRFELIVENGGQQEDLDRAVARFLIALVRHRRQQSDENVPNSDPPPAILDTD